MIHVQRIAETPKGEDLFRITLESGPYTVRILNLGATIQSLIAPDRDGRKLDVVLGFENPFEYLGHPAYFGQVVGRFANRIKGATFTLDDKTYRLDANDGTNSLHSGSSNWGWRLWAIEPFEWEGNPGVVLSITSQSGEGGFPGSVTATVSYLLDGNSGQLRIEYEATASEATPMNLTNHSYFNLAGAGSGTILNHEVELLCDRYVEVDDQAIPSGRVLSVENTPFDFRRPKAVGLEIEEAGGYDHCFVLSDEREALRPAARVYDPGSGRMMEIFTTLPSLQFYTSNFLDGGTVGKGGVPYQKHAGMCFETQYYPDSPNNAHFPNAIFGPDRPYRHTTVFAFSTK
ncbi:MAG: galactose mutarotase [Spirochaetales bacterium]|nr:galactose mutarotase [Spirochaetales bacterium]